MSDRISWAPSFSKNLNSILCFLYVNTFVHKVMHWSLFESILFGFLYSSVFLYCSYSTSLFKSHDTHALVTLRFCRVELSLCWAEITFFLVCFMVDESFSLRPELSFLSFARSFRYFKSLPSVLCTWVRSNMWLDKRLVATGLDQSFWFLNNYKNMATGNWTDPKFGQLQLEKDWTVAQSSSVLCIFSVL